VNNLHKNKLKESAKELLEAIKTNYESLKEHGISDTGSFIRQQYIADEMENLENEIKKVK
jgi:hypothetical protein